MDLPNKTGPMKWGTKETPMLSLGEDPKASQVVTIFFSASICEARAYLMSCTYLSGPFPFQLSLFAIIQVLIDLVLSRTLSLSSRRAFHSLKKLVTGLLVSCSKNR